MFCLFCAAALASLCAAAALHAAYRGWTGSGPLATGGGNRVVTALVVSPGASNVLYAGTASGTVFRNNPAPAPSPGIPLLLLQE
jgi:hypothetical protein